MEKIWLLPDVISAFLDELREAGYNLGVEQYVAVQDLVLALVTQGKILEHPKQLRSFLGPIVCSSAVEQDDFQIRFDRWFPVEQTPEDLSKTIPEEAKSFQQALQQITKRSRRLGWGIAAILSVLFLVGVFASPGNLPTDVPVTPPTVSPTVSTPSPSPTSIEPIQEPVPVPLPISPALPVPVPVLIVPDWQITLGLFALLSGLVFLIEQLYWNRWVRLFLERQSTSQVPQLQQISLPSADQVLFPPLVFLHIAQRFRQRVPVPSHRLAIVPTITKTLRNGGWFAPVYGYRQELPEYLLLIDRSSFQDHQARLINEMVKRLEEQAVLITGFYFDSSPQLCFPFGTGAPCSLKDISDRYRQHRLLIFVQADQFFSPITGELEPWVQRLDFWSDRAVLTPKPLEQWAYPELTLAEHLIVLPATPEGLTHLIRNLQDSSAPRLPLERIGSQVSLPKTLHRHPQRWLQRYSPPNDRVQEMLTALHRYLGADGFLWLSACAVFPELHWNITLYLGNVLCGAAGETLLKTVSITDLALLPWFRTGYLPDWLRLKLITALSPAAEAEIRKVLGELLVLKISGSVGEWQLTLAQREPASVLHKLAASLLRIVSRQAPPESPLRDYIFLEFMTRNRSKLALQLPQTWQDLLRLPHSPLIGRRVFMGLGFALVAAALTPLLQNLQRRILVRQPESLPSLPQLTRAFTFQTATVDRSGVVTLRDSEAQEYIEDLGNGLNLRMVAIRGGTFLMGQTEAEKIQLLKEYGEQNYQTYLDEELPRHEVTIPDFFMGIFTVTQAQYQALMGENPSTFRGEDRPVETVSWDESVAFCDRLSTQTGRNYRLPTEAEWEYACRAGTTTPFAFGDMITPELANYDWKSSYNGSPTRSSDPRETQPVGSYPANAWGLYDMHGNVWEWCLDHWHSNYADKPEELKQDGSTAWLSSDESKNRLLRGGSWPDHAKICRSAFRSHYAPDYRLSYLGFRVVCRASRTL